MIIFNKKLLSIVFMHIFVCTLLLIPFIVSAQEFQPLVPDLPLYDDVSDTSFTSFARGFFNLTIGIASVLAVIMIIIGGLEYMSTEAISGKGDAKSRIQSAVFGLLIALFAWIILNTINPEILKNDFDTVETNNSITVTPSDYYLLTYNYSLYTLIFDQRTFTVSYDDIEPSSGRIQKQEKVFAVRTDAEEFVKNNVTNNAILKELYRDGFLGNYISKNEFGHTVKTFPGTEKGEIQCEALNDSLRKDITSYQIIQSCTLEINKESERTMTFRTKESCLEKLGFLRQLNNVTPIIDTSKGCILVTPTN